MMTREQNLTLFDEIQKIFHPACFLTETQIPTLTRAEIAGLSLYENDDHVFLEAAVPGIRPDQIQISVEKGVVWIKAEEVQEQKDMKVHFQTPRRYSYRLPLPARIDEQTAPEAICKDGILKIAFAKSRSCRPMKINVKVA